MERLLIYPPFADPTQPYVSLPVLKGFLRSRRLDATVLDLNVEAAHHLFHPEVVDDLARRIGLRFLRLNHASRLDFEEQREYRALLDARPKIETVLAADPPPLEVFRRRELFFDPGQYSLATRRVEALFDALSAVHFPYRFDFQQAGHEILPWSVDLLERYWKHRRSPLDAFYRKVLEEPPDWDALEGRSALPPLDEVDFIGISAVFPSQLPEAFYLSRFLRDAAPNAFLALGGPSIHQIASRAEEAVLRRLLGVVDGIGLHEGEETLAALFARLEAWSAAPDPEARAAILREVPNLLFLDPAEGRPIAGPRHVVDLADAPAPDYSDLDLDRYLAPTRTLLYSPTRGCYWNRCSFCHYGLSESRAAAYREIPPERAVAQLARLCRLHGVRNVYLSADVLAPSWALRFAEAVAARGLKIRWSTDLKIERFFTPERCEALHRSGLRAAAFGMESGSDRVLGLIDKGTDRALLTEVNRSFHDAGVATQWMTFTDHPGETPEEALETVQWIEEEREVVDLFIVGEFGLESGSAIARDPTCHGVEAVYHAAGDDFRLHALFVPSAGQRSPEDRERVDSRIRGVGSVYALRPYPWAGAVSTHHTFLHFLELGQRAFRVHFQRAGAETQGALGIPPTSHIAGLRERPRFSAETIECIEKEFLRRYLAEALSPPPPGPEGDATGPRAPLCEEHYRAAVAAVEPLGPGKAPRRRAAGRSRLAFGTNPEAPRDPRSRPPGG